MRTYEDIGVQIPRVYLPKGGTDLFKWSVIACDQFTSQPEYWEEVEKLVGSAPSTLRLILPEVYLEKPGESERILNIQSTMKDYLSEEIIQPHDGMVFVQRSIDGKTRSGVMLCLDLERYDYRRGSASLIRATEGTIVERLPPRMRVRSGATLELPHILVLVDDPEGTLFKPLEAAKNHLHKLYDFELMMGSGHLTGYAVDGDLERNIIAALRGLARPEAFVSKYGLCGEAPVLLFAMGDGNHSLATAKAVWEEIKAAAGPNHPARYALVEVENVHDHGLDFEPIHRVLFGLRGDILASLRLSCGDITYTPVESAENMVRRVNDQKGPGQLVGMVGGGSGMSHGVVRLARPSSNLPVGTLQTFLDAFMKAEGARRVDYVHGEDVVCRLGAQEGNVGFYVPGMRKSDLFKTVILDGALPHKTFSMGHAHEKRFYLEARKIT
jgi:hypothetical protein